MSPPTATSAIVSTFLWFFLTLFLSTVPAILWGMLHHVLFVRNPEPPAPPLKSQTAGERRHAIQRLEHEGHAACIELLQVERARVEELITAAQAILSDRQQDHDAALNIHSGNVHAAITRVERQLEKVGRHITRVEEKIRDVSERVFEDGLVSTQSSKDVGRLYELVGGLQSGMGNLGERVDALSGCEGVNVPVRRVAWEGDIAGLYERVRNADGGEREGEEEDGGILVEGGGRGLPDDVPPPEDEDGEEGSPTDEIEAYIRDSLHLAGRGFTAEEFRRDVAEYAAARGERRYRSDLAVVDGYLEDGMGGEPRAEEDEGEGPEHEQEQEREEGLEMRRLRARNRPGRGGMRGGGGRAPSPWPTPENVERGEFVFEEGRGHVWTENAARGSDRHSAYVEDTPDQELPGDSAEEDRDHSAEREPSRSTTPETRKAYMDAAIRIGHERMREEREGRRWAHICEPTPISTWPHNYLLKEPREGETHVYLEGLGHCWKGDDGKIRSAEWFTWDRALAAEEQAKERYSELSDLEMSLEARRQSAKEGKKPVPNLRGGGNEDEESGDEWVYDTHRRRVGRRGGEPSNTGHRNGHNSRSQALSGQGQRRTQLATGPHDRNGNAPLRIPKGNAWQQAHLAINNPESIVYPGNPGSRIADTHRSNRGWTQGYLSPVMESLINLSPRASHGYRSNAHHHRNGNHPNHARNIPTRPPLPYRYRYRYLRNPHLHSTLEGHIPVPPPPQRRSSRPPVRNRPTRPPLPARNSIPPPSSLLEEERDRQFLRDFAQMQLHPILEDALLYAHRRWSESR